jgi:hypothetical protein
MENFTYLITFISFKLPDNNLSSQKTTVVLRNLSTHIMFGILVGALLFSRQEIALMVGVGSEIPDLDREYGFFSKESFRRRQIHRALFHNFLFIGMVYLIKPFFGIGAFLHSFLDSFTTTRDRRRRMAVPIFKNCNQGGGMIRMATNCRLIQNIKSIFF